ncbi:MAG: toxins and related Ca2+-binding protein [Rhodoglobus sp.]|nr:toxins and related Ca2+-binding protein [Rhodoglobus sp.]
MTTYPKVHTRMQTSSARKLSIRSARFDSSTGKRRGFWYSWRAIAAGLALALVAGGGIAVAAVSTASAHIPTITVTCEGIHVVAEKYNQYDTNTVSVTIDGAAQAGSPITFSTDLDQFFPFPTTTDAWDYTAEIKTSDATPSYSKTVSGTSIPCAPPSILKITAPDCTVTGSAIDLTADVSDIDITHAYTISLSSPDSGATNVGAAAFTPGGATGSYVWHNVVPGHSYTVTVTDTTVNLSASATVSSVGCPDVSGIHVSPAECTVPGGAGTMTVTASNLSFGRAYTIAILDTLNGNAVVQSSGVVGDLSGTSVVPFSVLPGGTYKATVTDDLIASSTITSGLFSYLPCPKTPDLPEVDPTQCTSTNGVPDSSIVFSASGLVPGRSYQVTLSDGTTTVFDTGSFVATAANWPVPTGGAATASQTEQVPPGTYTVFVTDVLLKTFVNSNAATITACPTMPVLDLAPTQCTVPGGTASIATSVTTYVPGRAYLVGLTFVQGGATVVAPTSIIAPASGAWTLPLFANLAAGTQYRVTVTDSIVTSVSAYGDISLDPCPGTPTITLQATCNVIGASTVNVSLDKLVSGETYTVGIVYASNNGAVNNVADQQVTATTATGALQFKGVPNGNQFTVNIANLAHTISGSGTFFLKDCDLPTLAFTGANPVGPAVAGVIFLQFGLVLVGLGLVAKRRRRTA